MTTPSASAAAAAAAVGLAVQAPASAEIRSIKPLKPSAVRNDSSNSDDCVQGRKSGFLS